MNSAEPLRVVVTRDVAESSHIVDAVVSSRSQVDRAWGDPMAPIIPRSAIKFVQTIPLVRTGAADAFEVSDVELALAAASHSGEPDHVDAVRAWLARIGIGEDELECGPDRPIDRCAAETLIAAGIAPSPIFNCCSGKHTGFLTIARHLGVDGAGYIERRHPVQQLVTQAIEELTDLDLSGAANGIDGCGIPTFALPAARLASAMARFAAPDDLADETQAAVRRLQTAFGPNEWWISGTGRPEVALSEAAAEPLLLKGGAEGVFMGSLPDRGIGIALKARDGSRRAADAAMAAVLEQLEVIPAGRSRTPVTNKAGTIVGEQYVELA